MFKASDILQTMQDSFDNKIRNDAKLQKIRKKIQNGADHAVSQQYAIRSGQLLSETLKENITADLFADDEELDAAELAGALIPMMEKNHGYVSAASSAVQKYMNEQGGLGMKPVEPEFDAGAAKNIVGRMSNYDSFEDAEWMLGEPMVANSIGIADESLRENAEFQYKSGLRPKIIRTCESGACEWCQMLAGEYDYDEVKDRNNPVYQRHNNCECEITFDPGDGKQSEWSDVISDDEGNMFRIRKLKDQENELEKIEKNNRDSRMEQAQAADNIGNSLRKKTPQQRVFEASINEYGKDNFDLALLDNTRVLGDYTPASMKETLERKGYAVTPLTRSEKHKNRPFEEGGGYKILYGGDGTFRYHPEEGSHHYIDGKPVAYYRLSRKKTSKWYTLDGEEFDGPSTYRRR